VKGHAGRRQLRDLMATKPMTGLTLIGLELAAAPATRLRVVIDDLIHLIRRPQPTTRVTMPGLRTLRSALALPAHQLLGLRSRLRAALRPRLRRIADGGFELVRES
jgi:hypothetical protein